MQPKFSRLLVGVLLLPLACFGQLLLVSESGTWSSTAPTTTWSAPNASWSYSFVVAANPTVSSYSLGNSFVAPFSNFTYTLNGSPVATTPAQVQWFSASMNGLYNVNFSSANFFVILGAQAYSGPESSPTILPGTYPLSGGSSFTSIGNTTQSLTGVVTITRVSSTVPALSEWGTIALAAMLLAAGGWQLRRRFVA